MLMLNRDLRLALASASSWVSVFVINPDINGGDYKRYVVSSAVDDGNFDDTSFTIIEVSDEVESKYPITATATVGQIRDALARFIPEDEVLIYVPGWEGQNYAYFKIDNVRFNMDHTTTIILGDWRHGG